MKILLELIALTSTYNKGQSCIRKDGIRLYFIQNKISLLLAGKSSTISAGNISRKKTIIYR